MRGGTRKEENERKEEIALVLPRLRGNFDWVGVLLNSYDNATRTAVALRWVGNEGEW